MGVGHRRGGRRAGGHHRRANRRQNRNRHRHHRRRHHGGVAIFTLRRGNQTSTTVMTTGTGGAGGNAQSKPLIGILSFISVVGIAVGMMMSNLGGWTDSALGIAGIVIFSLSVPLLIITSIIRINMRNKLIASQSEANLEAGAATPNMTVSTLSLEGGISSTVSHVGEGSSHIIQTGAVQPGSVAMGTATGNPGNPSYHPQPYPQPIQNYPSAVSPYPPNPSGATQSHPNTNTTSVPMPYPQPGTPTTLLQPSAPPVNYTTLYPPEPPSQVGVVDPSSEVESIPPPPSYDDVITGNVSYDEVKEL
nr:uncharacterized protein LOC129269958 [Lytechinus pictus]